MDSPNTDNPRTNETSANQTSPPAQTENLVPMGLLVGLAFCTVLLSVLSSFLFGAVQQQPWLGLAFKTSVLYAIGVPALVCLAKLLLERFNTQLHFYWRNTLALGWLVALSIIIWLMAASS